MGGSTRSGSGEDGSQVGRAARRFRFMDQVVETSTETEAGDRLLAGHFGGLPVTDTEPTMWVRVVDRVLDATGDDPIPEFRLVVVRQPDGLAATHEGGGVATVRGSDITIALPEGDEWRTGRHLLAWALTRFGNLVGTPLLHAAVLSRHGAAVVAFGASGMGKSTLAVAALKHGWSLHGDDIAVFAHRDARLVTCALPRRVMVAPEVAGVLAGWRTEAVGGDTRGRLFLLDAIEPTGWLPVVASVWLAHDDGDGELVDAQSPVGDIAAAMGDDHDPAVARRNLGVAAALGAVPTFELRHARSPEIRLRRAADMLDEVMARVLPEG